MLKILAIPGSLRSNSSNHAVINALSTLMTDVEFNIYKGIGELPHFDDSVQASPKVEEFRTMLKNSDGVVICSPEYAFGIPGSLKNAIDWTVGSGELVNKPTALITAATGGENAHAAWQLVMKALSAQLNDEGKLLIPSIRSKMKEGKVTDETTLDALKKLADSFISQVANHAVTFPVNG